MTDGEFMLLLVAIAGVIAGNDLVAIAAGSMLVMSLLHHPLPLALLDRFGISLGVVFLTIGLLMPFAAGKVSLASLGRTLMSPPGFLAVFIGAISSYLAADGLSLLMNRPEVMMGLVIGTLIGVSFVGGVPVGPLVAAGLAGLFFRLFGYR